MKNGVYAKLAANNLKKDRRFFLPRILTETGLTACFYIMITLLKDERLQSVRGGRYLPTFMAIGSAVTAILTAVLMLYINSFLMKQRKREFGLYSVLGMEKKHIARVLLYESLFCTAVSVSAGLLLGMGFYQLCTKLILVLLKTEVRAGTWFISVQALLMSAGFLVITDTVIFLLDAVSVACMKPVELLNSSRSGEKEPKVNILILIVGLTALSAGYYLALTVQEPLQALVWFFAAVLLVIAGTYGLFTAGSIFVLKMLKKNKNYYYSPRHMPSISGLLYRMKQNAVGLASVAVLSTCVLVMIASTVTLYIGMEKTIAQNYPDDEYVSVRFYNENNHTSYMDAEECIRIIRESAEDCGLEISSVLLQRYLEVPVISEHGQAVMDPVRFYEETSPGYTVLVFISGEMWEELGKEPLDLARDEAVLFPVSGGDIPFGNTIALGDLELHVRKEKEDFPIHNSSAGALRYCGAVVADEEVLDRIREIAFEIYGEDMQDISERIAVRYTDHEAADEKGALLDATMADRLSAAAEDAGNRWIWLDTVWSAREELYGMYGTLLFLGILLGNVFLFAAVLVIYYKQISEGYEDRSRFQIMEKVGMSNAEVWQTIRTQILLVFFLPIVTAGIHTLFAVPMLSKMLRVLMLTDTKLFICCTLGVCIVFFLVYSLIYYGTSRTYYKIVK